MSTLRRSARVASRPTRVQEPEEQVPVAKKARTTKAKAEPVTAGLEIGDKIPDVKLLNQDSEEVSLAEVAKSSKHLVVFAYPRANSGNLKSGCTFQLIGFENNYSFFKDNDTAVFGLSADSPKAQKTFHDKHNAEFDLLSDPQRELIGLLGAKKSPLGVKRSHWVFVNGILKAKEIQVSPQESFDGAKAEIEKLVKESKNGAEAPKEEDAKEEVKEEEPKEEEPKEENGGSKEEEPKEETKPEEPKEDAKPEEPKEEAKPEEPKEEAKPEETKEEVAAA
ncbi:Peroxiredoxin DOT5 [Candida viswanathii]|uniref:thioredoxin-dependent peroxiredoxin n=1 Tax=Candida viswanathii TaxID=5486 RepID=A0A367XNF8_9ASCO|nr:Peroxiredoxin DOT5 [Candida viswanathii]